MHMTVSCGKHADRPSLYMDADQLIKAYMRAAPAFTDTERLPWMLSSS